MRSQTNLVSKVLKFFKHISLNAFFCNMGALLLMSFVLLQINATQAQEEQSINLQGYYFSDAYRYSILEDTGILRFPGKFIFTSSLAYIHVPLVLSDAASDNKELNYLQNFWAGTLGFTYYVSSVFSIGVDANYLKTQYADEQPTGYGYESYRGDSVTGFGDTTIRAKIRLFRDIENKIGFSFIPKVELDTGTPEGFTTDESPRFTGLLVMEKYWDRLALLGSIGYSTSSSAEYRDIDYRSLLPLGFGASWRLDNTWNLNAEIIRQLALRGGNKQDAGDYYLTLKGKTFKYASFYSGFGIAGVNQVDQDNWTLFVGLKWHGSEEKEPVVAQPEPITEPVVTQAAPPVEPPPVIIKREQEKLLGDLFKADRVYFDNGKSNIKNTESKKLDAVTDHLIQNEATISKVIIEGYASKVGPKALNARLSAERADNVFNYLKRKGVNPQLLQTVSYGDDYLNEEPEHWMNRRVEFRIYTKKVTE